jgi:hypothetical protein
MSSYTFFQVGNKFLSRVYKLNYSTNIRLKKLNIKFAISNECKSNTIHGPTSYKINSI